MNVQLHFSLFNTMISYLWPYASSHRSTDAWRHWMLARRESCHIGREVHVSRFIPSIYFLKLEIRVISCIAKNAIYVFPERFSSGTAASVYVWSVSYQRILINHYLHNSLISNYYQRNLFRFLICKFLSKLAHRKKNTSCYKNFYIFTLLHHI